MMGDGMCKRDRIALMAAIIYAGECCGFPVAVDTAFKIDQLVADRIDGKSQKQEARDGE